MEEKKTGSRIPWWGWLLGCLAALVACAAISIIGLAAIFIVTNRQTSVGNNELPPQTAEVLVQPMVTEPAVSTVPLPSPTLTEKVEDTVTPPASATPESEASEITPPEVSQIPDSHAAERTEIEENVVDIRELAPRSSVTPTLLNTEELRQRLEEEFAEDYSQEEARQDAIVLSAFDLLSPEFDLYEFSLDLYTEEIAGFYDPETDEFVVISNDEDFGPMEQWVHAHEYVHALQDQYFDLGLLDDHDQDSEAVSALTALAEGDATLVQTLYLLGGYFDQEQLFDLFSESMSVDTSVLENAPPILARELEFPYLQGLEFVQTLYDQGGFEAVDEAWANLPTSTEQILHPDRYLAGDTPQPVTLEPLEEILGSGWDAIEEDTFGEFYLRQYLGQRLPESQVEVAASGWGGDRYAVYWNEAREEIALVFRLTWDTQDDADEFNAVYADYPVQLFGSEAEIQPDGGRCWTGSDVICLYDLDDTSLVVRAPDSNLASAIAQSQMP